MSTRAAYGWRCSPPRERCWSLGWRSRTPSVTTPCSSGSPIWSSVCCISFFLHSSLATIRTAAEHFCGSLRPRSSVPRCSWSRASSRPDASRFVALAIDYLGPVVIGIGRGWGVSAEHFAERFGLIVLIALGESIIAIGFGAGSDLDGSEACQAGRRPQTWSDESTLSRPPLSMEPRSGPTTRSPTFDARSILMA